MPVPAVAAQPAFDEAPDASGTVPGAVSVPSRLAPVRGPTIAPAASPRRYRADETVLGRIADDGLIRVLDILGALLALALAFPVMVLVALAVKLTSPGPVLFAHRRVGRHGRRFACLKFRTMAVDADAQLKALLDRDPAACAEWQSSQKLRRDPRVTSIGRFLRRSSLDELPQVFNVLIGDMSLVGPRPIVESEIPRYGRHFAIYCRVRPGVTGLWQVQRHADTSYRRRVAFDVSFARARSLRLYLVILARTVPAVLTGRGAW
ncbi:sugar transferase [Novosphingobium sp. FSW06-99]|uniref:sugar transferase n=1 Tax=Novosphingobium sp. FSW06-99 TaxID=1739113 RepID=UPI0018D25688